jgi:hypothetical protein
MYFFTWNTSVAGHKQRSVGFLQPNYCQGQLQYPQTLVLAVIKEDLLKSLGVGFGVVLKWVFEN